MSKKKVKIKGITYTFLIEQNIYDRLLREVKANNLVHPVGKNHLKLDVVLFFVNLITLREAQAKDISEYGYVPLKAEYLKNYHHQYKIYFRFLEDHGFILVKTYSILRNQCKRYKLIKPAEMGSFTPHVPKDFVLQQKLQRDSNNKRFKADKSTGHITKWLSPDHLKIDYQRALDYLKNTKMKDTEKYARRYLVERIQKGNFYYQREGKDNRLHSIISNIPEDIRPFLKCNGSNVFAVDLKGSQPYILAGLLNLIYISKNFNERKEEILKSISNNIYKEEILDILFIMIQESLSNPINREIEEFLNLIKGDIYDHIAFNLSGELKQEIQTPLGATDAFYNKRLGYRARKNFDSMRKYAKRIMLEYMNCSPMNKERRYLEVRSILPGEISRVIDRFKKGDKRRFPIFLQNVEAYLILDKITKKLGDQHPNIPLLTIHDSIVTTEENLTLVKEAMINDLEEFFGIRPKVSVEDWSLMPNRP